MYPVAVHPPRVTAHGLRTDRGVVMCLFESSPHWRGTLRLATLLASATGMALVLDPGGTLQRPRGRIRHVRAMVQQVGAGILVTTGTRNRIAGLLAPDHSPALVRATGIPTVLVPEDAAGGLVGQPPGGSALVCGVNDSPAAEAAVKVAHALAPKLELRLHLVHACTPAPLPPVGLAPGGVIPLPPHELERASREAGWRVLDRAERLAQGHALLRMRSGRPAARLTAYAQLLDAPLMVIGAPRRGPVAATLLGSVAYELATSCVTPLMIVPEAAP